jgi:endonuclease
LTTIETKRPFVWQMVREAIEHLNGEASYADIRAYIHSKYGDVNDGTITSQIAVCSVNHKSRVHYPENKKPRPCDTQYDFLYNTGPGRVVQYRPETHGEWEIAIDEYNKLIVRQHPESGPVGDDDEEEPDDPVETSFAFVLESHLRDFIATNLGELRPTGAGLILFQGPDWHDGMEYPTGVGPIDILAADADGNFVVFELKVKRGPDQAVGQILRYMGWVSKNLAAGKKVTGVIVAREATEKLKYAVSLVPAIQVLKYQMRFDFKPAVL